MILNTYGVQLTSLFLDVRTRRVNQLALQAPHLIVLLNEVLHGQRGVGVQNLT